MQPPVMHVGPPTLVLAVLHVLMGATYFDASYITLGGFIIRTKLKKNDIYMFFNKVSRCK